MTIPLISVIVPVFEDTVRLRACLNALSIQTIETSFEIFVVDNGSSKDIASVVDDYANTVFLKEERPGSYAARNRAIVHANGRILAFTDADCVPANDWLERGSSRVLECDGSVCIGGRVAVFPRWPDAPNMVELHEMLNAFPQKIYIEQYSFSITANLFVPTTSMAQTGVFDATLVSSGDREWGERAARAGVKTFYADDVVVYHPARSSVEELRIKTRRVQAGEVRLREIEDKPLLRDELARLTMRPPVRSLLRDARRFPTRSPPLYAGYVSFSLYLYYYRFYIRLLIVARKTTVRLMHYANAWRRQQTLRLNRD